MSPGSGLDAYRSRLEAMDYQALYLKYRPQRFDEVIGQDHVTKTLAREVVDGKVAHAYLFAGPEGVGKATLAWELARFLLHSRDINFSPEAKAELKAMYMNHFGAVFSWFGPFVGNVKFIMTSNHIFSIKG